MGNEKMQAKIMALVGVLLTGLMAFGVFVFNTADGSIPMVFSILIGIIVLAVLAGFVMYQKQSSQAHEKAKRGDEAINMYDLIDDIVASSTDDERRYLQDRVNRRRKAANAQALEMMLEEQESERYSGRR